MRPLPRAQSASLLSQRPRALFPRAAATALFALTVSTTALRLSAAEEPAPAVAPPAPPAADVPAPRPPPPPRPVLQPDDADHSAAAAVPVDPAHAPLLGFLSDYLYSQGAWAPGDLQVPYGPGVAILLSELVGPEEAKTLDLKTVPAGLQDQFRQAELQVAAQASAAYLSQLRALALQLSEADRPLAEKLIAGMAVYQTAMFQPARLQPAGRPRPPVPPPVPGAAREDDAETIEVRAERAANEGWMKRLSADELARVASCLAARRRDLNGVNYYDRTLRLFIGRAPLTLSDIFDAPPEFRQREAAADFAWKRQLCEITFAWQKQVLVLRRLAGADQIGKIRADLRPGLQAVLALQFDNIARQQALQHAFAADQLALADPALPADQRAATQQRIDAFPGALRKAIDELGAALETAWTVPMEKAFVGFYERNQRLDFIHDNLHEKAKAFLAHPAGGDNGGPGGPGGEHPDQF